MKKTITLSLCCMTALTVSAEVGVPDSTTLNIISIIFVVFGVLQIILFFKVWGMTNNVKEIRNTVGQGKARIDKNVRPKVRLLLLQGNKDAARCLLIKHFANTVG